MYAIIVKYLPITNSRPYSQLKAVMGDGEHRVSITIPYDSSSTHPDRDAAQALLDKYHPDLEINAFGHLPNNEVVATLINRKVTTETYWDGKQHKRCVTTGPDVVELPEGANPTETAEFLKTHQSKTNH
tara:strand:+ start:344 stop:730 length:387 start_codon:yes stop_codon:yes gene_type:complete